MIGYTLGGVAMLLVTLSFGLLLARKDGRGQASTAGYGLVTVAVIFAIAAVLMLVIGQAWVWQEG